VDLETLSLRRLRQCWSSTPRQFSLIDRVSVRVDRIVKLEAPKQLGAHSQMRWVAKRLPRLFPASGAVL
jgi:hypothetical protein